MRDYFLIRVLEIAWALGGLTIGAVIGYVMASGAATPAARNRRALWLAVGTLLAFYLDVGAYYRVLAQGQYLPRAAMAAIAIAAMLGIVSVVTAIVASAKRIRWIPGSAIRYRGQLFVSTCYGAFLLGMVAYLVVYPRTAWVFRTAVALSAGLGALLAVPAEGSKLPGWATRLNVITGVAAGYAGYATGDVFLMLMGGILAAAAFMLSR